MLGHSVIKSELIGTPFGLRPNSHKENYNFQNINTNHFLIIYVELVPNYFLLTTVKNHTETYTDLNELILTRVLTYQA